MGLDGQIQHGMISVVNAANLRILNVAAEQWDKTPRTGITNLTGAKQRAETIVAHISAPWRDCVLTESSCWTTERVK